MIKTTIENKMKRENKSYMQVKRGLLLLKRAGYISLDKPISQLRMYEPVTIQIHLNRNRLQR